MQNPINLGIKSLFISSEASPKKRIIDPSLAKYGDLSTPHLDEWAKILKKHKDKGKITVSNTVDRTGPPLMSWLTDYKYDTNVNPDKLKHKQLANNVCSHSNSCSESTWENNDCKCIPETEFFGYNEKGLLILPSTVRIYKSTRIIQKYRY